MEKMEGRTLHHFSHEHTLEHAISPSTGDPINCYGCNLRILPGKDHYICKTCSFSLHRECSSMPRKTKHPAHPNHNLTLLFSRPSANNKTFKCKACDDGITGFYYGCAKCGIHFHILCSALPLSTVISSHPHKLKMGFSPPYNFSCDMCHKISHKGWLYRCRFCEFDTHISCAIKDQKVLLENESNVLMQLLVQKFTTAAVTHRDVRAGQGAAHGAAGGGDERPGSSKENFDAKSGEMGLPQMKQFTPCSLKSPAPPGDLSIMISNDLTLPSYQFSDFCFSIDFLKSYSGQDCPFQSNKETSYHYVKTPQVEAKFEVDGVATPKKNLGNSHVAVEPKTVDPNVPASNQLLKDREERLNKAFIASQNEKKKVPNGTGSKPTSKHQKRRPDAASSIDPKSSSSSSSWLKRFPCFYSCKA